MGFRVLLDFASLLLFLWGFFSGQGMALGGKCLWLMAFLYEGLIYFFFMSRTGYSRGSGLFHSVCVFCIIALFLFAEYQLCFLSAGRLLLWEHNTVNFRSTLVIGIYRAIYR
jgi:hypothetical protein